MGFLKNVVEKIRNIFVWRRKDQQRKIGRNEPCWCGSKKKYKHCHLESDRKKFRNPAPGSKEDLSPAHRRLLGMHDFDDH